MRLVGFRYLVVLVKTLCLRVYSQHLLWALQDHSVCGVGERVHRFTTPQLQYSARLNINTICAQHLQNILRPDIRSGLLY